MHKKVCKDCQRNERNTTMRAQFHTLTFFRLFLIEISKDPVAYLRRSLDFHPHQYPSKHLNHHLSSSVEIELSCLIKYYNKCMLRIRMHCQDKNLDCKCGNDSKGYRKIR